MRKTVYHPKTGEPFEILESKANQLILEHGWTQTPIDPHAEPAVKEVAKRKRGKRVLLEESETEPFENDLAEEWRGYDDDEG